MTAQSIAAIGALIDSNRELLPVLEAHLVDNDGEVLSHLVMSDVIRWMVAHLKCDPVTCRSVLSWMEHEYVRGPAEVRDLLVVSGVHMIPDPGVPGSELRGMLGPRLQAMDPWLR